MARDSFSFLSPSQQGRKVKIFVSYSRADIEFVDRVVAALDDDVFKCLIDKRDLEYGELWQGMLRDFIREADAVLFVVSMRSVTSQWCRWELSEVAKLSKRLIPIVIEDIEPTAMPPEIGAVHLMPFDRLDVEGQIPGLKTVLLRDRAWVQDHTRLSGLALRWSGGGRKRDGLLRGAELATAETWKRTPTMEGLTPDPLVEAFISDSRAEATRAQRTRTRLAVTVATVALALSGVAVWQSYTASLNAQLARTNADLANRNEAEARRQRDEADLQRREAEAQTRVAERNQQEAEVQRDTALKTQSRFLADLAMQSIDRGDSTSAALLALEALPDARRGVKRPHSPEAASALNRALRSGYYEIAVLPLGANPTALTVLGETGKVAVASGHDVEIFDTATRRKLAVLRGHAATIASVSASTDGKRLITSAWDGTVRTWDVDAQVETRVITSSKPVAMPNSERKPEERTGISQSIVAAIVRARPGNAEATARVSSTISADGSWIATANADNRVRVYAYDTGTVLVDYEAGGCNQLVCAPTLAVLTPDGGTVFANNSDASGVLTDVASGRQITIDTDRNGRILAAAFSPDGRMLAIGGTTGLVSLYDLQGRKLADALGHEAEITALSFSPDGLRLVTGARDGARIWDTATRRQIAVLDRSVAQGGMIRMATFATDSSAVLTIGDDVAATAWHATTGEQLAALQGHVANIRGATFLRRSPEIATIAEDRTLRFWRFRDGETAVRRYLGPTRSIDQAAYNRDGETIAAASSDGFVRLWNSKSGKLLEEISNSSRSWNGVGFSHDGSQVAFPSGQANLRIWDLQKRAITHQLASHDRPLTRYGFLDDGSAYTLSSDATAIIWDLATSKPRLKLRGHGGPVTDFLAFPNRLVTAHTSSVLGNRGEDLVLLWDRVSGDLVAKLTGHGAPIGLVRRIRDSNIILTAAQNGSLKLWDVNDGSLLKSLEGHRAQVAAARSSTIYKRLVTASRDGVAIIWNTEDWSKVAELKVPTGLPPVIYLVADETRVMIAQGRGATPIFDVLTGRAVARLDGLIAASSISAVNRDGSIVVFGDAGGSITFWNAVTGEFMEGSKTVGGFPRGIEASPDGRGVLIRVGDFGAGAHIKHELIYMPWPIAGEQLIETAKQGVARCLTEQQRLQAFLESFPPDWCITGPKADRHNSPDLWSPLWPFQATSYKSGLLNKLKSTESQIGLDSR